MADDAQGQHRIDGPPRPSGRPSPGRFVILGLAAVVVVAVVVALAGGGANRTETATGGAQPRAGEEPGTTTCRPIAGMTLCEPADAGGGDAPVSSPGSPGSPGGQGATDGAPAGNPSAPAGTGSVTGTPAAGDGAGGTPGGGGGSGGDGGSGGAAGAAPPPAGSGAEPSGAAASAQGPAEPAPAPRADVLPADVIAQVCGVVRLAGAGPLRAGDGMYRPDLDPDGNGLACE